MKTKNIFFQKIIIEMVKATMIEGYVLIHLFSLHLGIPAMWTFHLVLLTFSVMILNKKEQVFITSPRSLMIKWWKMFAIRVKYTEVLVSNREQEKDY